MSGKAVFPRQLVSQIQSMTEDTIINKTIELQWKDMVQNLKNSGSEFKLTNCLPVC